MKVASCCATERAARFWKGGPQARLTTFTCTKCGRCYRRGAFWTWYEVSALQDVQDWIAEHQADAAVMAPLPLADVAPAARLASARPPYAYAATLRRAVDGDTYEFDLDLGFHVHHRTTVRLLGWNAPELDEVRGQAARDAAGALLASAAQIIVTTTKDKQTFARWLATVSVDGADIGALLLARGLASRGDRT